MNIFEAIILGLVQGIAEFLPISSSGHLVLTQKILGVDAPGLFFDVLLHIGTLIPIFIVYWKDIFALIKKPFQKYVYLLIIGTIPAVIFTLLFEDTVEMLFEGTVFLGVGFIITGCLLLFADKPRKQSGTKKDEDITYLDAFIIGCFQAFAITPAVSRSGSTITGSMFRGLDRTTAARFSFLMSIPAIGGAFVLQVAKMLTGEFVVNSSDFVPYLFGFLAAALSGYLAIRTMLVVIQKAKLKYFSYYVFAVGTFVILDSLVFNIYF
ncbi:MAG: undecaprenyl-diphosphate phosphatase [Lachnospirales bacterium]